MSLQTFPAEIPLRANDVVTAGFESSIHPQNDTNRDSLMADHKHGEMDITVQTETYDGFIKFTVRSAIVLALLALFLAVFAA